MKKIYQENSQKSNLISLKEMASIFSKNSSVSLFKSENFFFEERAIITMPYVLDVDLKKYEKYEKKKEFLHSTSSFKKKKYFWQNNINQNTVNFENTKLYNMNNGILKWPENDELNWENSDELIKNQENHKRIIRKRFRKKTSLIQDDISKKKFSLFKNQNMEKKSLDEHSEKEKKINTLIHFQSIGSKTKKNRDMLKEIKKYKKLKNEKFVENFLKQLPKNFLRLKINHNEPHKSESSQDVFPYK